MNYGRLYEEMIAAFGVSIQDPIPVLLGAELEDGTRVLGPDPDDTDTPGLYYFRELPSGQTFRGVASNSGRSPLRKNQLRWGNVIYVRRDTTIPNLWVIDGMVPGLADEYLAGLPDESPEPVQLSQFVPGMIDQNDPPDFSVRLMGAPYSIGDQLYYVETQILGNFDGGLVTTTGDPIDVPSTNGESQYILAQLDATTGVVSYKAGEIVSSLPSHYQVHAIDAGSGTYQPQPDRGLFRCGYVRLIAGMTRILRGVHIWQVQEIITKSSSSQILDNVLVDDNGDILVDDNGNILVGE